MTRYAVFTDENRSTQGRLALAVTTNPCGTQDAYKQDSLLAVINISWTTFSAIGDDRCDESFKTIVHYVNSPRGNLKLRCSRIRLLTIKPLTGVRMCAMRAVCSVRMVKIQ